MQLRSATSMACGGGFERRSTLADLVHAHEICGRYVSCHGGPESSRPRLNSVESQVNIVSLFIESDQKVLC